MSFMKLRCIIFLLENINLLESQENKQPADIFF